NSWWCEGTLYRKPVPAYWFTGTNLIEERYTVQPLPDEELAKVTTGEGFWAGSPPLGPINRRMLDMPDGNPGHAIRSEDLMGASERICWLALCSGPALKVPGRKLYPSGGFWKNHIDAPDGFVDKTETFDDTLGLPRSVDLILPDRQCVFRYQALR